MRDINRMTVKTLKEFIKRNWTLAETASEYAVEVEILKERIDVLLKDHPQKKKEIYADFEANEKIPHQKPKQEDQDPQSPQTDEDGQHPAEEPKEAENPVLALRREKQSLSEEISDLEKRFYDTRNEGRNIRAKLRKLDAKNKELFKEAEKNSKQYHELSDELDKNGEAMNGITEIRRGKLKRLDEILREIDERTNIVLCVTSDGAIEAPDNPEFFLDDTGYFDVKAEIVEREECLDLTMRQITTLAKLIKVAEKAERFTLICDSEELEMAFWVIHGNQQQ